MPRFFTETINESKGIISGDDAKHIAKVLRMHAGEKLVACDCQGYDYDCVIESLSDKEVELSVEKRYLSETEPSVSVTLYQAMPKSDKMELIIQKAVELGVSAIVPVQTKRCVSRPDAKSMAKKLERYNRIALEAAKQCGRGRIPQVLPMLDFADAIKAMKEDQRAFLFYENSTSSFRKELEQGVNSVSIMVGAEGGFEEEEVQKALDSGIASLSLGKRILRCETAPLAALSIIMYETGNM
ncbi:MAG: 16S rRNA (uracil(1498)-N(3))-methyltransferase [Ruminococcaceae bacterium]|nr:16S rRNA (uracil(1498)-N(3))-methyltransferase [Oscillospiraceae bacterium]